MADADREVLSSLPRTRPQRRSAKRGNEAAKAQTKVDKGGQTAAKAKPKAGAPRSKPRAAQQAPPHKVPPAGYAVPKHSSPVSAGGGELVGTAIQALGELASLGASLGSRALRDALGRL